MLADKLLLPDNLTIRMARPEDRGFLESLYRSRREDLRQIDAEPEFVDALIAMQQRAQEVGYGDMFPDACYFLVEKQALRIGRIVVNFDVDEVRLVDIVFIPEARGRGYAKHVLRALQLAATKVRVPLTLAVHRDDWQAMRLYAGLGFVARGSGHPVVEELVWFPSFGDV